MENQKPEPQPKAEIPVPEQTKREIEAERNKRANDKPVATRRARFLMINPQDFLMLFTKGLVLAKRISVFTGVPADAQVVSFTTDHVRGGVMLLVTSEEYEEIPMTDIPPVQIVEIEQGVKDATKKAKTKRKK